ncbi:MAG: hypothetical protein MUO27_09910 [Sedimentisphaerales bacterium]|nr:hypothetical protein [Sedimentisphaerales bacterium]
MARAGSERVDTSLEIEDDAGRRAFVNYVAFELAGIALKGRLTYAELFTLDLTALVLKEVEEDAILFFSKLEHSSVGELAIQSGDLWLVKALAGRIFMQYAPESNPGIRLK